MPALARPLALPVALALAVTSCGIGDNGDVVVAPLAEIEDPATSMSTSTMTTTSTTTTTTAPAPAVYFEQDYAPMTVVGDVTITHAAARVEIIGFHQAGHDGSREQNLIDTSASSVILDDRGRNTSRRGAADVVVDPTAEIRSPVTGTVIRGGAYVLYCDYDDNFLVIEPDDAPGWEVKVFHMEDLHVGVGDRVEAGVTPISPNSRRLPFVSQVDAFTAEPSNPHVHIEVIDPSIPDIARGNGGSC